MRMIRLIVLVFLISPLGIAFVNLAQSSDETPTGNEKKWFATIYYGIHSVESFGRTVKLTATTGFNTDSNYLAGISLGRELLKGKFGSIEAEGTFFEHFGSYGNYGEYVGTINFRYHYFPWNKYVKTSIAMSEGLSYTDRRIDGESANLLNCLGFELTLAVPSYDRLSFVYRIHHRSAAEKITSLAGDTNFYTLGLRYKF